MEVKHPDVHVQLTGTDGNTLALLGRVTSALKAAGYRDDADELMNKVFEAESYDHALRLLCEYVEVS